MGNFPKMRFSVSKENIQRLTALRHTSVRRRLDEAGGGGGAGRGGRGDSHGPEKMQTNKHTKGGGELMCGNSSTICGHASFSVSSDAKNADPEADWGGEKTSENVHGPPAESLRSRSELCRARAPSQPSLKCTLLQRRNVTAGHLRATKPPRHNGYQKCTSHSGWGAGGGGLFNVLPYLPCLHPLQAWNFLLSSALWPAAPSSAASPPSEVLLCERGEKGRV